LDQNLIKTVFNREIHLTSISAKCVAGRYRVTIKQDRPLTYEMANKPQYIAARKSWNSWNTSSLEGVERTFDVTVEDFFIRKFIFGTWHRLFLSEVIIKRRANLIVISGIIVQSLSARKIYFLIGYTEQILSYILKCPVKIELQTTSDKKALIFKYI
jgi:small subunit ribosomal protein S24